MCVGGRLRAVLALFLWCGIFQGTQLAPAFTPAKKPIQVYPTPLPLFSTKKETEDSDLTAGESPRFHASSSHPCDGSRDRLELPVPFTGCPQRAQQELLQQLRFPLGISEMVASSTGKESFTEPKEEGSRKEENHTERIWTGEDEHHRHLGAFWNWRPSSESMGGNYPDQNGDGFTTGSPEIGRGGSGSNNSPRGEDRGDRQVGPVEEDIGSKGSGRPGDPGPTQRPGDSPARQGWNPANAHPQNPESIAEGGEAICSRHNAIARARRTVEEMESVYATEIYRTREALQGEEESCYGQDKGAGRTTSSPTSRDAASSTEAGRGSEGRRLFARARGAALPGDRHGSLKQRGRGQEETSPRSSCSGKFSGEATQENMTLHRVRFDDTVAVKIYGSNTTQNCYEFTCPMDSLEKWDSKPWALYEGNFVNKAQQLLAKVCRVSCDHLLQRGGSRDWGRGDGLLRDEGDERRHEERLFHCGVRGDPEDRLGALQQGDGEGQQQDQALSHGGAGSDRGTHGEGERESECGRDQLHQCGEHHEWGSHEGALRDEERGAQGPVTAEGTTLKEKQATEESPKPGMLHLFGIDGAYLGRREYYQKQFDFGHSAIRAAIEETWKDHFGEGTTYHVPRPQPSLEFCHPDIENLFVLADFLQRSKDGMRKRLQLDG